MEFNLGEALKSAYYTGKSIETLARENKLSRTKVTTLLKKAGTTMRTRVRISDAVSDAIVEGYTRGMTMTSLGKEHKMSADVVKNNLIKRGITLR